MHGSDSLHREGQYQGITVIRGSHSALLHFSFRLELHLTATSVFIFYGDQFGQKGIVLREANLSRLEPTLKLEPEFSA